MHEFKLPSMTCGHCASRVAQAIKALDPDSRISVNLDQRTIQVQSQEARAALSEALTEAGYQPA